ncbi:MAG: hypothetical protein R3E83_05415 [Burkholderiaceae bacterium]
MIVLDALWWLILGLLAGWAGLWLFDRLTLRDGEVAGLRAARELAEARQQCHDRLTAMEVQLQDAALVRESLREASEAGETLRAQLSAAEAAREGLQREHAAVLARESALRTELDETRRTVADRASEIERLKNQLHEANHQRDAADRWGQAKDNEAGELRRQLDALQLEHDTDRTERDRLRIARDDQDRVLATLKASYDSLESEQQQLAALLPRLRLDVQAARRQARELSRRAPGNPRVRARLTQRLRGRLNRLERASSALDDLDRKAERRRADMAAIAPAGDAGATPEGQA